LNPVVDIDLDLYPLLFALPFVEAEAGEESML
jgi:hypothetical protein